MGKRRRSCSTYHSEWPFRAERRGRPGARPGRRGHLRGCRIRRGSPIRLRRPSIAVLSQPASASPTTTWAAAAPIMSSACSAPSRGRCSVPVIIPALDGVREKLERGADGRRCRLRRWTRAAASWRRRSRTRSSMAMTCRSTQSPVGRARAAEAALLNVKFYNERAEALPTKPPSTRAHFRLHARHDQAGSRDRRRFVLLSNLTARG